MKDVLTYLNENPLATYSELFQHCRIYDWTCTTTELDQYLETLLKSRQIKKRLLCAGGTCIETYYSLFNKKVRLYNG